MILYCYGRQIELVLPIISGFWKFPSIGRQRLRHSTTATQNISQFWEPLDPARLDDQTATSREHFVDLALRFETLALCAVFAFVSAILLGAF